MSQIEVGGYTKIPHAALKSGSTAFKNTLDKDLIFSVKKGEFSGSKVEECLIPLYSQGRGCFYVPRSYDWQSHVAEGTEVSDARSLGAWAPMDFLGNLIEESSRN